MKEFIRHLVEEARAKGQTVHYEIWNEAFHGQEAINVLNGLPPDADASEVKGCFNDFLQDIIPSPK